MNKYQKLLEKTCKNFYEACKLNGGETKPYRQYRRRFRYGFSGLKISKLKEESEWVKGVLKKSKLKKVSD